MKDTGRCESVRVLDHHRIMTTLKDPFFSPVYVHKFLSYSFTVQ